jgi:hypothetical protein
MQMTTIDELENELEAAREREDEAIRANAALKWREIEAEAAAKRAEDAKLYDAWIENEKLNRIKIYVPAGIPAPNELIINNRIHTNYLGYQTSGPDPIPSGVENGRHVIYLRSLWDFNLLRLNENVQAWSAANPDAMRRLIEIMPKTDPLPPDPMPPRQF